MSSSLIKFMGRQDGGDGRKLFWGRADTDGLPFRGHHAPIMPDEEYEARVVQVADAKNAFFDVADAAQNKAYLAVLDGACNGWYKIVFVERFWQNTTRHYVEWIEYFCEDGSPRPFTSTSGMMELAHGSGHLSNGSR